MPVRKRFGQNFLRDQQVIRQIVNAIAPTTDDCLIEIGPGHGALTEPLVNTGANLEVIEIDRDLVIELSQRFPHLNIHSSDILKFDFDLLPDLPLRIIGNLPYYISTPLLFKLFSLSRPIKDMHFMLQREVVDRICAEPGDSNYGRLSVMAQIHCEVTKLFTVPPGAFSPPPKVYSAVLRLKPKVDKELDSTELIALEKFLAKVFSQRRKTIRNAMKGYLSEAEIRSLDLDPGLRPENLTVSDYIRCIQAVQS